MTFIGQPFAFFPKVNCNQGSAFGQSGSSNCLSMNQNPAQGAMMGLGLLFAGMDMIDNGQLDGSLMNFLNNGSNSIGSNQSQPYAMAQAGPNGAQAFAGNNQQCNMLQNQNPMMNMMMQMMQMMMQIMMQMFGMVNNFDQAGNQNQNNGFMPSNGMQGNDSSNILGWNPIQSANQIMNQGNYGNQSFNPLNNNGSVSNNGINSASQLDHVANGSATKDSVYKDHENSFKNADLNLSSSQKRDLEKFKANYAKNKDRYDGVSKKTGVPSELIAALHWRESSGNFNTYLHQGDPLGKPAVHVPRNIPVFHKWEDSAVHALNQKGGIRDKYGLSSNSNDVSAMLSFAERYNGLGYHNKGKVSPYVYAGTDVYSSGKYVADGVYSSSHKDTQLGVLPMLMSVS